MNPTPSKKPIAIVMVLLAIGIFGISYWHYQDMVKPIPEFESLKQIPADGMRYEIARPRGISSQVGFEFTDQSGNRFQTDYMEAEEARAIKDALERGGVILSVGRWEHAIESNSIFTVYHMTRGDKVLVDYKRVAESKKKEQQVAVPVVVISLVLTVGIVVFVFWRQYKRARF
jgi:flagellar basal body-associated protein FliL